jgi:AraC family transcriptional regulator
VWSYVPPYNLGSVGDLSDLAKVDYRERVNRAIDYITRNLASPLRLDDVAQVACFSPYHFHRIFRAGVGETLHDFTRRVRLERAVFLMSHAPGRSLTDIALACGFASSSDFSRAFRQRFGVAPRAFDLREFRRQRRDDMNEAVASGDTLPATGSDDGEFCVRLRTLPARRVAYLRVFQPYEPGRVQAAAARLVAWARARGLADGQWLGYQWEDPEIVPPEQCRYDVGLEVPEAAVLEDGVSEARFPSMTVAEVDIAGSIALELRALDWLYKTWLPQSGFVPDHQPGFEAWHGEPFAHGDTYFAVRLQLPVVRADTPF